MVVWPKTRQSHGGGARRPACEARANNHRRSRGNLSLVFGSTAEYVRSWLHLLGAAAYGGASMQLCIELLAWHSCRLLAACSTRRYDDAARTRAKHAARCDPRVTRRHKQRRGVHGRTVRLATAAECSAAAKTWQKREWTFAGFSAHTYRLSSAPRCVLCTLRQLSPVAVYSCAVSRSCRGSSLTPLTCSQFKQKHLSLIHI